MKRTNTSRFLNIDWFIACIVTITLSKIILAALFSSDYQSEMFMPFVNRFFEGMKIGDFNPYQYYYKNNLIASFPYPSIMLIIESIGCLLIRVFNITNLPMLNLLFKLPIFIFDIIGLYYLIVMFPKQKKYLVFLYYASPIIIYADYMHGQLDIIPIAILVVAIYYLLRRNLKGNIIFVLLLSVSIATKQHIVAVVPILLMYVYKRDNLLNAVSMALGLIAILIGLIIPFYSKGLIETVLFNNEQNMITNVYVNYQQFKLYIPILAVIFIYLKAFCIDCINKDLLFSFIAIMFSTFLAFVPPMPGWYVWIVPFSCIICTRFGDIHKKKNVVLIITLNVAYLIFYIIFHDTQYVDLKFMNIDLDYIKISNAILENIAFTFLTSTLLYLIYMMYRVGIDSNSLYKRRNLPFTIGIAGDSGSGKSTLLNIISDVLGKSKLLLVEGDSDHRWERGEKDWEKYTPLNPKANFLYKQSQDIELLRNGHTVSRAEYDHSLGKFMGRNVIKPKKYIIVSGLHALYLPQMRKNLDLRIYLDTDDALKRFWKIRRDILDRGYSKEIAIAQYERRISDFEEYIQPQKEYADLLIRYFDDNLYSTFDTNNYNSCPSMSFSLSSVIDLEPLINILGKYNIDIMHNYSSDLKKQTMTVNGQSLAGKSIPFNDITENLIDQLDEITPQKLDCRDIRRGIIQLILLALISKKMNGEL